MAGQKDQTLLHSLSLENGMSLETHVLKWTCSINLSLEMNMSLETERGHNERHEPRDTPEPRDEPLSALPAATENATGPLTPTGPTLHKLLSSIIDWKAPPTKKPEFSFRWSTLAAKTNWEILQQYDMDLGHAITAQPFSTLTIGSKF